MHSKSFFIDSTNRTLAAQIDAAFATYFHLQSDDISKEAALNFLIMALDIREIDPVSLNLKLISLQEDRNNFKQKNPEYIPGKKPRRLKLKSEELILKKTTPQPYSESEKKIDKLITDSELIDVREFKKQDDILFKIKELTPEERNTYRVLINKGLLIQNGEPFDTSKYRSHQKIEWGAFTLNANGELSIFSHGADTKLNLFHSSTNAGTPLYSAGEIIVKNGKLIALNLYSGHYFPKLYDMYRTLQYLSEHDVDISEAMLFSRADLSYKIPSCTRTTFAIDYLDEFTQFKTPCKDFYKVMTDSLNQSVAMISKALTEYGSYDDLWLHIIDSFMSSSLTQDRKNLADDCKKDLSTFLISIKDVKTDFQLHCKIEEIDKILSNYIDKNEKLSAKESKDKSSGRLAEALRTAKAEIQKIQSPTDPLPFDIAFMKQSN